MSSIEAEHIITIKIEDMTYRYALKNEMKGALTELIPKDEGFNVLRVFLENFQLRL